MITIEYYHDNEVTTRQSDIIYVSFFKVCTVCGIFVLNIMESSSENEVENVPDEISNAAAAATEQLLPEKSKLRYEKVYNIFIKWMEAKKVKTVSEDVILAYLAEKSAIVKSSSLWSMYSMLKSTILVKKNVNIAKFPKVIAFLKKKNVGYKPKKSAVFSREQINKLITEADNEIYLMIKVILTKYAFSLAFQALLLPIAFYLLLSLSNLLIFFEIA